MIIRYRKLLFFWATRKQAPLTDLSNAGPVKHRYTIGVARAEIMPLQALNARLDVPQLRKGKHAQLIAQRREHLKLLGLKP